MRHRVILLGVRDDIAARPQALRERSAAQVPVSAAIDGLPRLRSGLARTPLSREQWAEIAAAATSGSVASDLTPEDRSDVTDSDAQWLFMMRAATRQEWFRELDRTDRGVSDEIRRTLSGLRAPRRGRGDHCMRWNGKWPKPDPALVAWLQDTRMSFVCDHSAREHMPTDHYRYLFAAAHARVHGLSPRLRDFPKSLLPRHNNVNRSLTHDNFADRFRVQVRDAPGSTVLSHIAKDGHYFIHHDPAQARSLSVREVARLQTFPDNYFFFGNRSEKYVQIGNAVPPLLSFQIAGIVSGVVANPQSGRNGRLQEGSMTPPADGHTSSAEHAPKEVIIQ